jgi:hypothetical protein
MTLDARIRSRLAPHLLEYASREAWGADRGSEGPTWNLGATDAASIMGVGWGSPWDVWAAGQGKAEVNEPSDVMLRGSEWEPLVLDWYRRHHGREVWAPIARVVHPDAPWLRPSPDGFTLDSHPGLIEVKCPRLRDGWGKDGSVAETTEEAAALAPIGYVVQVYAQLAATGLPWCDLVACWGPQDTRTLRIIAQPEYQARLLRDLAWWRELHLVRGETPEIDASDACGGWLARLAPEGVRDATPEEAAEAVEIRQLRKDGEEAVEEAKIRARRLGAAMNCKTITAPGVRVTIDARGAVRIT